MRGSSSSVVFDTGVVLQAALRPSGPAGRLVALLDQDVFALHVSPEILDEYEDVLSRRSIRRRNPHLTYQLVRAVLERIWLHATLTPVVPCHFVYARDPDDERVINLAIETGAAYVISRDKDLLDLMDKGTPTGRDFRLRFPSLSILDPVDFIRELIAAEPE